ncbi:hypothetical protein MYCTH_2129202 [Thermothelomyces thermophilus ATCC 42464]|uniref:Uncharacterized protein n=1 Tax=Thermothelomyces thermophilus (strain ATCC 42464 / BCRC 31852 / DSM 1799) TaxID=573729 RepID=G2QKK4_THET4|nr:uncharacterized protein MYCTH_2129202 [Thermothelomyces thermophilus ATCC 42464]AEO60110.1 hypothetical protein MYCTH_2129202 [Thermothelomyces thermophilus ATCC 42464]
MISLVDEKYYERAWCYAEAVMISGLDVSSKRQSALRCTGMGGYQASATGEWTLEKARDLVIKMNDKKLMHEQD